MSFLKKDTRITGRYITLEKITPLLADYKHWKMEQEGSSVLGLPIPLYKIGNGATKILIWSQMHGNESTTTKALLDVILFIKETIPNILNKCSLYIILILNPDGAKNYTRVNANGVDLNRDAQNLTQPESQFLRQIFDTIEPDFCFNMHDQRTIFSAGKTANPATISFLAPAGDLQRHVTEARRKSMQVISVVNSYLQAFIPNQIGRFDDSFNINCTGDQFTTRQVPTILFEAGHYPNDYQREQTRQYVAMAIYKAIECIANNEFITENYTNYFQIPENEKLFCDILIKNDTNPNENLAIFYQEVLKDGKLVAVPQILSEGKLENLHGHLTILLSDIYKEDIYNFDNIKNNILHIIEEKIKDTIIF
ncbi:M14 family zinc carboxypeptidase [Capnocytophaga catalasegens]|uniref:Peptidase M14 n=1 Tax=Capnocytophaga catalasegens TaxID=1004260 RepID=A0AAV5AWB9_9FLAO|nr:M14 family zinc carboxypeptidase [Capnocytophaga catalasegens]GIZ14762.1 peptidase M14 [Capnocytophaga catalasegens]GJM50610.1 peptidase M14 [Capnocytophaga catalasegens]GJM53559.1 peptidase M14 [Capnocytophaga catalasegens]